MHLANNQGRTHIHVSLAPKYLVLTDTILCPLKDLFALMKCRVLSSV
jgi:hypothetical protein